MQPLGLAGVIEAGHEDGLVGQCAYAWRAEDPPPGSIAGPSAGLRRATAVLGVAVAVLAAASLAGVLAPTTLGAKAPLPSPSVPRLASQTMFIAFIDPKATTPEISTLDRELVGWEPEQVKSCRYVDKAESFAEFKERFRADPGTLKATLDMIPPSFRCTLAEAGGLPQVARQLVTEPGIYFVRAGSLAAASRTDRPRLLVAQDRGYSGTRSVLKRGMHRMTFCILSICAWDYTEGPSIRSTSATWP